MQSVPCRARPVVYDCQAPAYDAVEERGFAYVGASHQGNDRLIHSPSSLFSLNVVVEVGTAVISTCTVAGFTPWAVTPTGTMA